MIKDLKSLINKKDYIENEKKIVSNSSIIYLQNHYLFLEEKLSKTEVLNNLSTLKKIVDENEACKNKKNNCINLSSYHLFVKRINGSLYFYASPCNKLVLYNKQNDFKNNFIYNYYGNSDISNAFLNKESFGIETYKTKNDILKFFKKQINDKEITSSYIYGKYGVGKTFISVAFANEIAKNLNKKIIIIYLPDFVNLLMQGFSDLNKKQQANDLFNNIINCDVLFLDDIGSEYAKEWFYSNYFLNILNSRCTSNKPIIFNSNLSINKFREMLSSRFKTQDSISLVDRIIDRIKVMVNLNEFILKGQNMRENKVVSKNN